VEGGGRGNERWVTFHGPVFNGDHERDDYNTPPRLKRRGLNIRLPNVRHLTNRLPMGADGWHRL
jgi:hypothetical protein